MSYALDEAAVKTVTVCVG